MPWLQKLLLCVLCGCSRTCISELINESPVLYFKVSSWYICTCTNFRVNELKVDYLVMPACTKSLIVKEIKTDSGLAWIYMYFTLVSFHWNCQKKKLRIQKQKEHVHVVSILIKDQLLYQILQIIKRPETPEMNEY